MANNTRIYVVKEGSGDAAVLYLVRAASTAQAVNAIAKPKYFAQVASQDDLVTLSSIGKKVIEATE